MAPGGRKARCKWPWSLDTIKVGHQEALKDTCSVSPRGLVGACAFSRAEDICQKIDLSPGWHGPEAKQ